MAAIRAVAVVGANLAGGRAVEALRQDGFDGRITVVGAEPHRPYERPPLSKDVLLDKTTPADLFLRDDAWYDEHDVDLRLGVRATDLDPNGTLTLDGAEVSFDACLLATGGRPRTLDVPGSDLEGITYLRTLDDAVRLAAAFDAHPRLVVVGAGFIGAEVAASARSRGCEVTMIEIADVPLGRVLGEDLGRVYTAIHRDHGVDLRLGEGVERFEGSSGVEAVVGTSGTRYPAELVVVGVGIVPNVELAESAGIACANGITTDERCRTSHPSVWAAGDVSNRPDPWAAGSVRVEHFQNAQDQGRAAARSILGRDEPYAPLPWFWSDQYDVNLQMFGHPNPGGDRIVRGRLEDRECTILYLDAGRIVAAILLDRATDAGAVRRLMERRIPVDPAGVSDPDVSLRDLLRGR